MILNTTLHGLFEQMDPMWRAIQNDKLAHAYLFYGPEGTGKKTFAKKLSLFLLGARAGGGLVDQQRLWDLIFKAHTHWDDAQPQETFAQEIAAIENFMEQGNHPDFMHINAIDPTKKTRTISVDKIRKLAGFMYQTAQKSSHKIVMIEDADLMTPQAANALLKMLEEPAQGVVFFLIANTLTRLLPTILSRVQKIAFQGIALEDFQRALAANSDSDHLDSLYSMSEGAVGKALYFQEINLHALYHRFRGIMQNALDVNGVDFMAVQQLGSDILKQECMPYFQQFFLQFVKDATLTANDETPALLKNKRYSALSKTYDHALNLFHKTTRLNLDPYQVYLNAFYVFHCQLEKLK